MLIFFDAVFDVHPFRWLSEASDTTHGQDADSIAYSVQIFAAYGVKMNADSIKSKFGFQHEVREVFHKGWYKYSVGRFSDINEARNLKALLRNHPGLGGAFLVCFKNDIRQDFIISSTLQDLNPAQANVEYRIQIYASLNNRIHSDTIAKWFSLIEKINVDFEDGWYKYSVGSFTGYSLAKNFRDRLRQKKGLENCFIIAFDKGRKLSHLPFIKARSAAYSGAPDVKPLAEAKCLSDTNINRDSAFHKAEIIVHKHSLNRILQNENADVLKKKLLMLNPQYVYLWKEFYCSQPMPSILVKCMML